MPAAILIVHGGEPNPHVRWLSFCLERICRFTPSADYHLFVWNDRPSDTWVRDAVAGMNNATLVTMREEDPSLFPDESFLHADRLQRLYALARSAGYRFIVTMDTDAHPLRAGWLDTLRAAVVSGAALAGVWHEEQPDTLDPYIHPSCLATTADFVERHQLRFDEIAADKHGCLRDTLCHFTTCAEQNGYQVHRLWRSNRNQFHSTMGGIYGDLIYHHGGGSRRNIRKVRYLGQLVLDEDRIIRQNLSLSGRAAEALLQDYDRYLAWLTDCRSADLPGLPPGLIFVLGMHRSGTSCLTGALGACGCHLGDVERTDPDNPPGGNIELPAVVRLNNRILTDNGGAWDRPPSVVRIQPWHQEVIRDLLTSFRNEAIGAVKDPRMLLVAHGWLPVAGVCSVIGTFRHPLAVARSLARRDAVPIEKALRLWCAYNWRLVQLHKQFQFPLIHYQFDSPARYRDELERSLRCLGLGVDRQALDDWIKPARYSPEPVDDEIPRSCRAIFEYLRNHSISATPAPTPGASSFRSLIFAPDADELSSNSWQSVRRLVYKSFYRLALAYHRLPYSFRVWVRKAMGRRLPVPKTAVSRPSAGQSEATSKGVTRCTEARKRPTRSGQTA